ncbi:formate dehydrogenase accessory sulfurtransferase FdhD [Noviherbaspirillum denitrificans]|uniref:Sulfur carrier protein FdhD n=1 Tax=Noviherbaspirillum denitrificans TaxID=1968433 RepID=A0A254TG58_9BURK|nr:formate dehydrogenase accessory sulfurtransferase FdhD [Noviherbaspirillum denitrificans]OWW20302.1 sufurtransferase FdhD [Noviherbaspirillum denitrificans]
MLDAFESDGLPPPVARRAVYQVHRSDAQDALDSLAEEVPVALEYNGVAHAVLLATPAELELFALGFSLSEGIVASAADVYDMEIENSLNGITIRLTVSGAAFDVIKARRRQLAGRTGCGLCGVEQLNQVVRPLPSVGPIPSLSPGAVRRAVGQIAGYQPIASLTGATHAAAWCSADGQPEIVFEDVGRHNALDKLIGALARRGFNTQHGFVLITSRASVEMVQKAATAGIAALVAVSAPTALAVRTADACGMMLIGFARVERLVVYSKAGLTKRELSGWTSAT